MRSKCCNARVNTGGISTTNFYVCLECGKPCDVYLKSETTVSLHDTSVSTSDKPRSKHSSSISTYKIKINPIKTSFHDDLAEVLTKHGMAQNISPKRLAEYLLRCIEAVDVAVMK